MTGGMREALRPDPVIVRPALPAECRLDPASPDPLAEPELPPLPPRPASDALSAGLLTYYVVRTQRAEIAGLYFQNQATEERETRETNAGPQRICAAAVRALDAQP